MTSGVILLQRVKKDKLSRARQLRLSPTPAEMKLWQHLRRNQIACVKFRRQQLIEGFIVDFFCHKAGLVIEIDGEIHTTVEQQDLDAHRRAVFEARGLMEIRFRNEEVMHNFQSVISKITEITMNRISSNPGKPLRSPP